MRFEPKANKTAITKREKGGGDRGNAAESDGPRAGADGKQATVEIIFFDFFPLVFVRNFFLQKFSEFSSLAALQL